MKLRYNMQHIALISEKVTITYSQLAKLQRDYIRNIAPRSLVMIICSNTVDSVIFYVACIANKVVPILIDKDIKSDRLNELIKLFEPNYLYMPIDRKDIEMFACVRKYNDYALYRSNVYIKHRINDELALLLSTSGSTGSSKFVRISYENLESNIDSIIEYLGLTADEVAVTNLPMSYTYGLSVINTHLYVGATIVVTENKIFESKFWELVYRHNVTSISGVPFTYEILKRIGLSKIKNSHIRTLTQAGGRLSADLQRYFAVFAQENNINLYIMYGQTEATSRISYLSPEYALSKIGSVGIAVPTGKIIIENDEIIYMGKNVTMGYAEGIQDLEKMDEFKGVLHTKDLGYMDEDGFLYITGRIDKVTKLFGKRIGLDEIENLLRGIFNEEFFCKVTDDCLCVYSEKRLEIQRIKKEISKYIGVSSKNIKYGNVSFLRNERGKVIGIYE